MNANIASTAPVAAQELLHSPLRKAAARTASWHCYRRLVRPNNAFPLLMLLDRVKSTAGRDAAGLRTQQAKWPLNVWSGSSLLHGRHA